MEIRPFSEDLNVIQKLDDEPNDVGGLTSAELKAKFDESGNLLKEYINDVLVPAIQNIPMRSVAATDDGKGNVTLLGYDA